MTDIEKEVLESVVFKLVSYDREGKAFISIDEFNTLYMSDDNRKEIIELLASKNIELRKVRPSLDKIVNLNSVDTDSLDERLLFEVEQAHDYLVQVLKREPTVEEIAKEMGFSTEQVRGIIGNRERRNNFINHEDIDELIGSDQSITEKDADIFALVYLQEIKNCALKALKTCEDIEIFKYYYGLDDGVFHTLRETAKTFEISLYDVTSKIKQMNSIVHMALKKKGFNEYLYDLDVASTNKHL